MGLFDFFKRSPQPQPQPQPEPTPASAPAAGPPRFARSGAEIDVARTHRLAELFAVPRDRRDAAWMDGFWDAAWTAALAVPEPPVVEGPDGFPYLRMNLPADTSNFEANSLMRVAPGMVERGVGAALFASAEDAPADAQYVISMGVLDSILNLDDPAGDPIERAEWREAPPRVGLGVTVRAGEQIMISTPSHHYLSRSGARALHRHLGEEWGLSDPRVALLDAPSLRPTRSLVIGVMRRELEEKGATDGQIQVWMERVGWHLPPSRSLMLMPEDWSLSEMTPLRELF